jgi:hypothetical protein
MNYADIGRQAASLSQRLFHKIPPDLLGTIVPPDHVHQSINRKSGTYLGLPLTSTVLEQFDEQY